MSEEEKELEAERLFVLFERLEATGVMKVMGVDENNEQKPIGDFTKDR